MINLPVFLPVTNSACVINVLAISENDRLNQLMSDVFFFHF